MRFYLLFFLLIAFAPRLSATHIVGGEITYECLGNDSFQVHLTIFRDCDTGVPWFDDPAAIGIFSSNNLLLETILLPLTAINDTLEPTLSDPCLVVPPNVCIHRTTYSARVRLPFRPGGYQLVYQRCCRNQDIVNIILPEDTGATYYTYISEQALIGCNNSIVFREWPPVYICLGYPISFDHSATDADGDSIVYELCAPLEGATPQDPMPQPPNAPPYNAVVWGNGFSMVDMLGNSADPFRIDAQTGMLSGSPDALGVYVIGICAKEYRNGILISTTRRDFQYAVGICGRLVSAAFLEPDFDCNNSLTVSFMNESESILNNYFWNFDTTDVNSTSTLFSPSHTYPDTGTYTVMLVADPGTACVDTIFKTVEVYQRGVQVSSIPVELVCKGDTVHFVALCPQDTLENITYQWSPATNVIGSTTDDTLWIFANQDAQYKIVVENEYGCKDSTYTAVNISTLTPPLNITAAQDSVYEGNEVQLFATQSPDYIYSWASDPTLSDTTIFNPIAAPIQPTTYYLTVTWGNDCVNEDSITIYILPPICGNPLIFLPNAFTPNGDGLNDVLYVRGVNVTELYFTIYNRWGERVFESNSQAIGWDGTQGGTPLPPDVYGYYFRCRCEEGQSYFQKGNVTLLR